MDRWSGRVAVVTGASAGIGASISEELVKKGLKVVGLARRVERIQELAEGLKSQPGKLYALKCDITKETEVQEAFKWIKSNVGGVDILINNAGVASNGKLISGPVESWKSILDLNVLALSVCTKEALQSMKERGVDDGHIIHINSVVGHTIPNLPLVVHMYCASKHAVTALTEGLRRELVQQKSKIRVTSVSPGMVETEFMAASGRPFDPKKVYGENPHLEAKDVSDAIMYALGVPPHVQIHEITIKPVGWMDGLYFRKLFLVLGFTLFILRQTTYKTMERWSGRVAMVTGASAGIGASVAQELVKKGLKVVGLARRLEKIQELADSLKSQPGKLYPLKCDITKETEVQEAFKWVKSNLGGVDILINNAGVASSSNLIDGPVDSWKSILDLNVLALSVCTKEALQSMKERGVDDGHIVHINSVLGHVFPNSPLIAHMYCASKSAVLALTEGLRRELVQQKSKIKISSVTPGLVETEFMAASGRVADPAKVYASVPHLQAEDVSDAVLYVLATPPHVQVHEIIVKPVGSSV
ncbi:uncharacterized protein [Periplaneta americana]|uniref:uncharacterized protein n=1 Tax=Periplaneta americana TaxID=6978 RepID=UPI0037E90382